MIYSRLDQPALWNAAERHPTAAKAKRRAKCPARDGQKLEIFKFCTQEQLASALAWRIWPDNPAAQLTGPFLVDKHRV